MKKAILFILIQTIMLPFVNGQKYQRLNSQFSRFMVELNRHNEGKFLEMPVEFFYNKDWSDGILYVDQQNPITDIKVKYSVYTNQMYLIFEHDTLALKDGNLVDSIKIGNSCFIYTNYKKGNSKIKESYFEQLTSKNIQLLKQYCSEFVKGKKEFNSYEEPSPDRYTIRTHYFTKVGQQPAIQFSPGKKKIKKLFSDKEKQIERFIKEEGIKTKKEEDLIKLFRYYNSLL